MFSYFEIDLNRTHPLFPESLFFSLMYSTLILKEFEKMDGLDQITKQDISNNVDRIKSKLLKFLEKNKMKVIYKNKDYGAIILNRLKKLT